MKKLRSVSGPIVGPKKAAGESGFSPAWQAGL